jgi:hypothetical protein
MSKIDLFTRRIHSHLCVDNTDEAQSIYANYTKLHQNGLKESVAVNDYSPDEE